MLLKKFYKRRKVVLTIVAAMIACPLETCLSTDLAKRFREVYGPEVTSGLSAAITNPSDPQTGILQAWAALIDGLGALISVQPNSSSSSSGSSSSSS